MTNPVTPPSPEKKPGLFVMPDGRNRAVTFALVSSLFLLWGFCNGMIDVMDKHFQEELHLSLAQSAWVQFAHYLGYFLMALPAGWIATRLGYKGGIIFGLLLVALGGFWFIPATKIAMFWAFLLGVCLIAAGLTFLETVANPYTTVLGPPEFAAARINLAQSCNGIGWILGPIAGGMFFYGTDAAGKSTGSQTLWIPYVAVAVLVLVLVAVFKAADLPDVQSEDVYHLDDGSGAGKQSIWTHPHFVFAVVAQFAYVAAQSGIFSFFINYMTSQTPAIPVAWQTGAMAKWFQAGADGRTILSNQGAAFLASLGFFCFLAGRFSGAAILKKFSAHTVLGLYGLFNVVACGLVALKLGWLSVVCVFASYFFMSIMFPTIFALGIHGLGSRAKQASAFIVMAIMGGAIVPKLMGAVGDHYGMSIAFLVPLACFAVVMAYGFGWKRLSRQTA
ncbi:MAG: sugar MFS transporter [Candidatus Didemnitutus sp.]|nr:sugar MFS transporter [Candidatus Didemnitutus sp.]